MNEELRLLAAKTALEMKTRGVRKHHAINVQAESIVGVQGTTISLDAKQRDEDPTAFATFSVDHTFESDEQAQEFCDAVYRALPETPPGGEIVASDPPRTLDDIKHLLPSGIDTVGHCVDYLDQFMTKGDYLEGTPAHQPKPGTGEPGFAVTFFIKRPDRTDRNTVDGKVWLKEREDAYLFINAVREMHQEIAADEH